MKSVSEACFRNQKSICHILKDLLLDRKTVLEIGSGTGQHGVYFAQRMLHITWQTSDLKTNHEGIQEWIEEAGLKNLRNPLELDVNQDPWPELTPDAIFTANTLHILSWEEVKKLIQKIGKILNFGGIFCVYGPFNYKGTFTSSSNRDFDEALKITNPLRGIRDFEAVTQLMTEQGLNLIHDYQMPANNRLIVWGKISPPAAM